VREVKEGSDKKRVEVNIVIDQDIQEKCMRYMKAISQVMGKGNTNDGLGVETCRVKY
jgi:hypothetical protein